MITTLNLIQKVDMICNNPNNFRGKSNAPAYKRGCYDHFETKDKAWSKFFETQLKAKNKKDSSKYYLQQGFFKLTKDLRS